MFRIPFHQISYNLIRKYIHSLEIDTTRSRRIIYSNFSDKSFIAFNIIYQHSLSMTMHTMLIGLTGNLNRLSVSICIHRRISPASFTKLITNLIKPHFRTIRLYQTGITPNSLIMAGTITATIRNQYQLFTTIQVYFKRLRFLFHFLPSGNNRHTRFFQLSTQFRFGSNHSINPRYRYLIFRNGSHPYRTVAKAK